MHLVCHEGLDKVCMLSFAVKNPFSVTLVSLVLRLSKRFSFIVLQRLKLVVDGNSGVFLSLICARLPRGEKSGIHYKPIRCSNNRHGASHKFTSPLWWWEVSSVTYHWRQWHLSRRPHSWLFMENCHLFWLHSHRSFFWFYELNANISCLTMHRSWHRHWQGLVFTFHHVRTIYNEEAESYLDKTCPCSPKYMLPFWKAKMLKNKNKNKTVLHLIHMMWFNLIGNQLVFWT